MRRVARLCAALAAGFAACIASAQAETLRLGAAVAASQPVEFEVFLPLRNKAGLEALLAAQQDPTSHLYHQWLTPASFAAQFGPDAATIQKVARAFTLRGLSVQIHSRSIQVSGSAAAAGLALNTRLVQGTSAAGHQYLVAASSPALPQEAAEAGAFIIDFSPVVHEEHVDSKLVPGVKVAGSAPLNRLSPDGGYFFDDLKQAYSYPSYQTMVTVKGVTQRLDGTGVTIGILMSSNALDSDVKLMFDKENFSKIAGVPTPTIYAKVKVNGGAGLTADAWAEASLDTQMAAGGAPGAHVVLYEIPNLSNSNIILGYLAIDQANQADVVSSSFGGCDLEYTQAYAGKDYNQDQSDLALQHELFEQGNAQGISFLASSGDSSGLDCPTVNYFNKQPGGTFVAGVENPADDPNVTAVGGTNLVTYFTPYSLDSTYYDENAWNDPEVPYDPYGLGQNVSGGLWGAGGGLSALYPRPDYQTEVKTGSATARTVPDVGMQVGGCPGGIAVYPPCDGGDNPLNGSGNSDRSYVFTAIDGNFYGLIGTSVSSPEFASATALLIETKGRMGNLNIYLYKNAAKEAAAPGVQPWRASTMFHVGIPGYNGVVENTAFGPTYNYTTGLGTPYVYHYVLAPTATPAGAPQTPSNP